MDSSMTETAGEPIRIIRETTRNLLKLNRQVHKDEISDLRRAIETNRVTSENVADLANRLKNKSSISLPELHTLKNSLIDHGQNIELVLSTHGSLRGLVRELTGTDVKRQCAAAGCCCNLALGNSKACMTVAKAAGPYLVAALDSLSEELAVTCTWAIGNMAGSGEKACETLSAQGAMAKLITLLCSGRQEVSDAAVYALTHFASSMEDNLSSEYVEKIMDAYRKLEMTPGSCQLLFVLSCHHQLPACIPEPVLHKVLNTITVSTVKHINTCKDMDVCCELVHLFRTLANISVKREYSEIIVNKFILEGICVSFQFILFGDNVVVKDSLLWLLGNVHNACGDNSFFYDLACCSQT